MLKSRTRDQSSVMHYFAINEEDPIETTREQDNSCLVLLNVPQAIPHITYIL